MTQANNLFQQWENLQKLFGIALTECLMLEEKLEIANTRIAELEKECDEDFDLMDDGVSVMIKLETEIKNANAEITRLKQVILDLQDVMERKPAKEGTV